MSVHTTQTGLHIAIVGYGSACLVLLKCLQDLPEELRRGWRVTVFERREGLGGQWWGSSTAGCMSMLTSFTC